MNPLQIIEFAHMHQQELQAAAERERVLSALKRSGHSHRRERKLSTWARLFHRPVQATDPTSGMQPAPTVPPPYAAAAK